MLVEITNTCRKVTGDQRELQGGHRPQENTKIPKTLGGEGQVDLETSPWF